MMQVSVILPIFNGARTLSATLDSLVSQTYTDFEVIACIDGSTDASEAILKDYALKFKKLTIFKNKINLGLGPTMNRLLNESKGDYIAIAEQDDYYYPERLQLQVKLLDENHTVGLVSGIAEFWDGDVVSSKFPGVLVHGKQYPEGIEMFMLNYKHQIKVVNSCMMFRKRVHLEHGLYFTQHYPSVGVDWAYILRFSLISNIQGLQQVLVRVDRRRDRQSVTANRTKTFKASRELIRGFAYEYPNIVMPKDYQYAMRTQYLMEINSKSGVRYLLSWLQYYIQCPFEKRYIGSISKRILLKMKIYFN